MHKTILLLSIIVAICILSILERLAGEAGSMLGAIAGYIASEIRAERKAHTSLAISRKAREEMERTGE